MKIKKTLAALFVLAFLCLSPILVYCSGVTAQKASYYKTLSNKERTMIDLSKGYTFGDVNAPVTIVEYSSYECKDCAILHNNISEILYKNIKNRIVHYIFKPINHKKFNHDFYINTHFVPKDFSEIEFVFDRYDLYANKDLRTIKKNLQLTADVDEKAIAIDKSINKELDFLQIRKTPTLIINNREYTAVIFTASEFESLIRELENE